MKVLFMGSGTFGLPVLDALAASRHTVAAVVTAPDKPQGRGRVMTPSPIKVWAEAKKVPALTPSKLNTPETIAQLKSAGADVFVVASYGALLSEEVLALPPLGCVNVHPSLLPLYRGASPVVQALLDGRTRTGMTIMAMAKDLDAGDILLQESVGVGSDEDARALTGRLARMGGEMTVRALDLLEAGDLKRKPQDHAAATYCSKLKKEHGRIDWTAPARVVHDRVRALVIWPGSFTTRNGKQVKVLKTRLLAPAEAPPGSSEGPIGSGEADAAIRRAGPGGVLGTRAPAGLIVKCGDGSVAIEELQSEGGRPMRWKDFVNGSSIKPGDRFE